MSVVEWRLDHDPGLIFKKFGCDNIHVPLMDADQLVCRDGDYMPVALFETTHCYTSVTNQKLLDGIDRRLNPDNPQVRMLLHVASRLEIRAYVVLFHLDCEHFAARYLKGGKWHFFDRVQFIEWVEGLRK